MNKKNSLLISGGSVADLDILRKIGTEVDFILCADGGTDYCYKAWLTPDMIIGDLDSISHESLNKVKENNIPLKKFPIRKDATDTELSIDYLIDKGFKDITLVGATGSRMDHTLGNILLLNKLNENGIKGRLIDKNNMIYLVDDKLKLINKDEFFISVIPISTAGAVVTLKGFDYELDKFKIKFSSTQGISNKIVEDIGYITVHKGTCLVFVSKD